MAKKKVTKKNKAKKIGKKKAVKKNTKKTTPKTKKSKKKKSSTTKKENDVVKLTGVPNSRVDEVVDTIKSSIDYISHILVKESTTHTTIIVTLKP